MSRPHIKKICLKVEMLVMQEPLPEQLASPQPDQKESDKERKDLTDNPDINPELDEIIETLNQIRIGSNGKDIPSPYMSLILGDLL